MTEQKLTDEEYRSLCRFFETVEDDGTFDIGQLMIKTLSHKKNRSHRFRAISNYRLRAGCYSYNEF